jgi:hypothetical protein
VNECRLAALHVMVVMLGKGEPPCKPIPVDPCSIPVGGRLTVPIRFESASTRVGRRMRTPPSPGWRQCLEQSHSHIRTDPLPLVRLTANSDSNWASVIPQIRRGGPPLREGGA